VTCTRAGLHNPRPRAGRHRIRPRTQRQVVVRARWLAWHGKTQSAKPRSTRCQSIQSVSAARAVRLLNRADLEVQNGLLDLVVVRSAGVGDLGGGFVELPVAVDAARIEARFKDGVLHVTLPKTEEAKPKQIDVKVS
jgi:Hsp20/alpha crystallin family protein